MAFDQTGAHPCRIGDYTAAVAELAPRIDNVVPEISRFFGIIIRMFMEAGAVHHTPHFHAYYHEHVGVFSLDPVELIAGDLPRAQRRLVEAWAELHQVELKADWERLQAGRPPLPIAPLQ